MPKGSIRYRELCIRLNELGVQFLPFLGDLKTPVPLVVYSAEQLDSTRAYLVLVHAEIEQFLEDCALERARAAKLLFDGRGVVTTVLRRLVAHITLKNKRSWGEVVNPSADSVDRAINSFNAIVRANNGLKRDNIEKLLFPLGFLEADFNMTLVVQLDNFGFDRGAVAHQSSRVGRPPDPFRLLQTVQQIAADLLELDRSIAKLR